MYTWLTDALLGSSTVVTANRRLARVLQSQYAERQANAGKTAWKTPAIYSWQDWLEHLALGANDQASLPTRISSHHSHLLWERCLEKEITRPAPGLDSLVRLSRDTWQRLADWRVTIREVAGAAQSGDQRMFAAAAGRYLGLLEQKNWVDDAGLVGLVESLIRAGRTEIPDRVTLAGFDRERPAVISILAVLEENGCEVATITEPDIADSVGLQRFETTEAELRAAGKWAREHLQKYPDATIAIIAGDLDRQADTKTRLVREGLVPGWQYTPHIAGAVNVSFGRKLSEYPAVSIAVLLLHWLVRNLSASEVGHLLRTPLLGSQAVVGRSGLELKLRQLPDRGWSPAMLNAALQAGEGQSDAVDWLGRVASLTKARRELKRVASPREWAEYIDETLKVFGWPGSASLSSFDFQLVNRWRELLNDLARLELVSPSISLETAIRQIERMSADAVFQPESETKAVQLLGPLEASGAQFDALWITGLTAAKWPPAGNPSPLISRQLQRRKGMPDAEPSDTIRYAETLLRRLGNSGREVICSYAVTVDDTEQAPSGLIDLLQPETQVAESDPGWHATALLDNARAVVVSDSVPTLSPEEEVAGGAATIQRQIVDPISAFVVGRLGVRYLQPQAIGLPPSLRGSIIHDALYQLYRDTPSSRDIASWSDSDLDKRIHRAVNGAFARHERNIDDVLAELFSLERRRIGRLLQHFVEEERSRGDFSIAYVEHEVEFAEADLRLQLRVDRIDRLADESFAILDYKTGATKRFLQSDGQPRDIQLVAYACALDKSVSAIALVNVDTREVTFEGAGYGYTEDANWDATLSAWKSEVRAVCEDFSHGDVRITVFQNMQEARKVNLLSRYTELLRDA